MKNLFLLFIFTAAASMASAQRFFYVEKGTVGGDILRQEMVQASQYLSASPFTSDYIIKTETASAGTGENTTVKISMVDSTSFKTVFEVEEKFATIALRLQPQIFERMAFQTLLEKNFDQIILISKGYYFHRLIKSMDLKKDKT